MTVRRIMIDQVDLLVRDLEASRRFYEACLAPLGYARMNQSETFSGLGAKGAEDFAINLIAEDDTPTTNAHVAFVAETRELVKALYEAALAAGGHRKQAPAVHPEYSPTCYGAFDYDPDGNNIEAVCHQPE